MRIRKQRMEGRGPPTSPRSPKPLPTRIITATSRSRTTAPASDQSPKNALRGGIFGFGLSREIKRAYQFLVEAYEPGDELYFFGYSRGAYMARSTAGFVRNAGILRPRHMSQLDEAYMLYRNRDRTTRPSAIASELFRRAYSYPDSTRVRFIGVWDTVGALGIPFSNVPFVSLINRRWSFHDTEISAQVGGAFQALAIDEKRPPFEPTLWCKQPDAPATQRLEQVWFAGVHGNVGGGGVDDSLSDITLQWVVERAEEYGLLFDKRALALSGNPAGRRGESWKGWYRILFPKPKIRTIAHKDRKGLGFESAASTAVALLKTDRDYKPQNLLEYCRDPNHLVTQVWPDPEDTDP
jgi:uncharacterized protein (DUF2235 family)